MRLCFGIFAKVLNFCRKNTRQDVFIAKIVKCIEPGSSYISSDYRYSDKWDIEGDKVACNKLIHCVRPFVSISNEFSQVSESKLDKVRKKFEINVAPLIKEEKRAAAILALLDIIQRDKVIDNENAENFKKYLGVDKQQLLQQGKFIFSDFIIRILLYTVYGNVDNCVGKEYKGLITKVSA